MKTYTYTERTKELAEIMAYGICQMCYNDNLRVMSRKFNDRFEVVAEMPWGFETTIINWEV